MYLQHLEIFEKSKQTKPSNTGHEWFINTILFNFRYSPTSHEHYSPLTFRLLRGLRKQPVLEKVTDSTLFLSKDKEDSWYRKSAGRARVGDWSFPTRHMPLGPLTKTSSYTTDQWYVACHSVKKICQKYLIAFLKVTWNQYFRLIIVLHLHLPLCCKPDPYH